MRRSLPDPNRPIREVRAFLPYASECQSATLDLEVRELLVDGRAAPHEALSVNRRRILPYVEGAWSEVNAQLSVPLPDTDLLNDVLSDHDDRESSCELVGRVVCPETLLRQPLAFTRSNGHFIGHLELRREDVERAALLQVFLVRTRDASTSDPARALDAKARLAISPTWIIQAEPQEPPSTGAFDFAYVDFSNPQPVGTYDGQEAAHLRAIPHALSYVVYTARGPLILLNEHEPEIVEVLTSRARVGRTARIRDVLLGHVAREAWRSILLEAAHQWDSVGDSAVDGAGDGGANEHWAGRALRHAAKKHPLSTGMEADDLAQQLMDVDTRPGVLSLLAETLGGDSRNTALKLIQEGGGQQ